MPWNLTDEVSSHWPVPVGRRAFYLPLASVPPRRETTRPVDQQQFTLDEEYVPDPLTQSRTDPTRDITLEITIRPPTDAGEFVDEDGLPDPAIRLHAMGPGRVYFRPTDGRLSDRLILAVDVLPILADAVPWWKRWIEAKRIPHEVIYEDVDRAYLVSLLNQLRVGRVLYGLMLPVEVTQSTREAFIADFFAGSEGVWLFAQSGAVIGKAGTDGSVPDESRLLKLHARYRNHTEAAPQPMNPRELLYLFFGDQSAEATQHPLLLAMDSHGGRQSGLESRRMLLRPPLRTYARVMWEARQEVLVANAPYWNIANSGANRLYNRVRKQAITADRVRTFNDRGYEGSNKCNLFISDVCLRSGFRVNIHPVNPAWWHYTDANTYCNRAHTASEPAQAVERIALQGMDKDKHVTWGWKIEGWLRHVEPGDRAAALNALMDQEGRCLILAGARPRKFRGLSGLFRIAGGFAAELNQQEISPALTAEFQLHGKSLTRAARVGVDEPDVHWTIFDQHPRYERIRYFVRSDGAELVVAPCPKPHPIGHIVILKRVRAEPMLLDEQQRGTGLSMIDLATYEATSSGAQQVNIVTPFQLGGTSRGSDSRNGFIRMHLIELHPGGDPDTMQELQDLNVFSAARPLLSSLDERANRAPLNCADPPSQRRCCVDHWPAPDSWGEAPCPDCRCPDCR